MTLNDNPRVVAERRRLANYGRFDKLSARYRKWIMEYDEGSTEVARLVWTGVSHAQLDKADRLRKILFQRIREDERFLKGFR